MGGLLIPGEGTDANTVINFYVYDANLALLATIPAQANQSSISPVRGDAAHTYYVPQLDRTLITISDTGVVGGTTWTLPANSDHMTCGAPNRGGTKYYYGSTNENPAVCHVYDLGAHAALPDLFLDGAGTTQVGRDILILATGDLLIVIEDSRGPNVWHVRLYHTDGTLVRSDLVHSPTSTAPRIALGLDDPQSYWVMEFPTDLVDVSRFRQIRVSDGASLTTFDMQNSTYGTDPNGPAQCCPLLMTQSGALLVLSDNPNNAGGLLPAVYVTSPGVVLGSVPLPASEQGDVLSLFIHPPAAPGTLLDVPIRRQRTAPHLWDGANAHRLTYPGFQLLTEAGAPRDSDTPLSFTLEWSDDGGHTWSNLHTMTASTLGQFLTRFWWRRLGQNRIGGDRVFRVTNSDDAKIVLIDALLTPDPVAGSGA